MTDAVSFFQRFVEKRKIGLISVALFFAAQLLYGHFYCSGGVETFLTTSAIVLIPGLVLFINWQTNWALPVFCGIIFLFRLWANNAECSPSPGGGAAMAYVVVMLFGWPIALLLGVWVSKIAESEQAGKDKN
jgi:hypothetical protein